MAIDTEQKRMSMLSLHGGRRIPQPDGTISQGDMQTFLGRYAGILFQIPTAVTGRGNNSWVYIFHV